MMVVFIVWIVFICLEQKTNLDIEKSMKKKKIPSEDTKILNFNQYHESNEAPFTQSAKLCPEDVLKTSPKDDLWTSSHGPLCHAKRHPLLTSSRRWNVTSWGCSHIILYVTLRDVPHRRLQNVLCRGYEDVPIWFNM